MVDVTRVADRAEVRIDPNTLRVTRRSAFTGIVRTFDLPITEAHEKMWRSGTVLIQNALPLCSMQQREFLLTGSTQEEWDAAFPEEDEDE